jgi:hypothetical protein
MGFQFNHVGGGTKTRRPIALHMTYNPACAQPQCTLVDDQGVDRDMTLEELQDYIEAENQRLSQADQFLNKDIAIKIEYKFCPNLTIIDTPGDFLTCHRTCHIPAHSSMMGCVKPCWWTYLPYLPALRYLHKQTMPSSLFY